VLHFDRRVLLHRLLLSLWVRTAPVPGKQDEILYGRNEIANGVPCDLVHTMYQTFFAFKMSCDQTVHACFLLDCHKERSTFPGPILTKLPNTQKTLRFRTKSFALIGISWFADLLGSHSAFCSWLRDEYIWSMLNGVSCVTNIFKKCWM